MKRSEWTRNVAVGAVGAVLLVLIQGCGSDRYAHYEQVEAGEEFSGGETTIFDVTDNAFGLAAKNMSEERKTAFFVGNSFFKQNWVQAPASTEARDGLGPLFIAKSCSSCHFKDGRGSAPKEGENMLGVLLRLSVRDGEGNAVPHPVYGDQLQNRAIHEVKPEGKAMVRYEEVKGMYADGEEYGLRRPHYEITELGYGELPEDVMVSPRIASQIVGMGLLEAISEKDLLVNEDEKDSDGDGISGRANWLVSAESGEKKIGRFGWKANQPTVRQQVAGAFNGDMGITSPVFPDENDLEAQGLKEIPNGGIPEIEERIFRQVVFYTATLAVPGRRNWDDADVLRGKRLFHEMDCAKCHVPKYETGDLAGFPELSKQVIYPYTDLLLHDMGEELADNRPDGKANGKEWRTPPLWGVGLIPQVNKHLSLMHDGRARTFEEAILWHGGEGEASREKFKGLSKEERDQVVKFLESL